MEKLSHKSRKNSIPGAGDKWNTGKNQTDTQAQLDPRLQCRAMNVLTANLIYKDFSSCPICN